MDITSEKRRSIPAIDRLMRDVGAIDLPRASVLSIVRKQTDRCRDGHIAADQLLPTIRVALQAARRQRIQPVINATGIIIHTNLGRSPLADEAIAAIQDAASNYTNLEFDLDTGTRGGRGRAVESGLALLCESEAATVVNNCAAALVLCVQHYTRRAGHPPHRKEVIISRGELVQIGGGFRIPEMLESAGATLREVGTTNRTTADDYARAISDRTAMILKVHHSNFAMSGFVESASLQQLGPVARSANVPLIDDHGSGAQSGALPGIADEPTPAATPAASLAAGADLVMFSGDKLLGGPQAGVIAGRAAAIASLKSDPMFRAFRCDKLQLSALAATVDVYLNHELDRLPIHRMINLSIAELDARAQLIAAALSSSKIEIGSGISRIGGGAAPEATIPSVVLRVSVADAERFMTHLRHASIPVIGYIEKGRVLLDLRTVFPAQDAALTDAIRQAIIT